MGKAKYFFTIIFCTFTCLVLNACNNGNYNLTAQRRATLNAINEISLGDYSDEIEKLYDKDLLNEFLDEVREEMNDYINENLGEQFSYLEGTGVNRTDKVQNLREYAEIFLRDSGINIQPGDDDFTAIVNYYVSDEFDEGGQKKSDEDIKFRGAYIYMCLYEVYCMAENSESKWIISVDELDDMVIEDALQKVEKDLFFYDEFPIILDKYRA